MKYNLIKIKKIEIFSEYFSSSTLQIDNDATNSELADDDFQFEEKYQPEKIRKRQTDIPSSNFPPPPNEMSYDSSFNVSDFREEPSRSQPETSRSVDSRNFADYRETADRETDDFGFSGAKPNFDPSMAPSRITHEYPEPKHEPDIFPKRPNPDDRPVIYIDDSIPKTMTGPIDRSFDEPKVRSLPTGIHAPSYKTPISFDSTPISAAKSSWKDRSETKSIETDSVRSGPETGGPFRGNDNHVTNWQNDKSDADDGASIYSYISDRTETSNRLPRLEKRDDFQKFREPEVEPEVWHEKQESVSTGCVAEPHLPNRHETASRETDTRSETGSIPGFRDRLPSGDRERFNRSRFDQQSVDSVPETSAVRPPSPGPRRTDVPPRYESDHRPPSPGARLRDVMSSYDRPQSTNQAPVTKPKILEPVTPRWGERTNVNKILDKFSGKQENTENSYLCRSNEIQSSVKPKM